MSVSNNTATSANEALQKLIDGNKRFVTGQFALKDLGDARREELVKGQKPFAVILTCSDSRVPPEHIFDQGLGDLFVVRNAGPGPGGLHRAI
jgi:carbonic anhydrase